MAFWHVKNEIKVEECWTSYNFVGPNYKKEVNDIFIKGVPQEMSLYVHRPSVTDKTCAPKGDDTFYVLACVPNLSFKNNITGVTLKKATRKNTRCFRERLLPGWPIN